MNLQKMLKIMLVLFVGMVILSNTALAQKWSSKQQEVWNAVENWWELYQKNDVEGIKALFHKDYVGWSWGFNSPEGQKEAHRWANHMIPKNKIAYTNLNPLDILVIGDVAVLHYYYVTNQTVDGKDKLEQGRWTDVWKKEGGKWLLIADSGGQLSTN
jgi:ketosteroid isomerase-like protein